MIFLFLVKFLWGITANRDKIFVNTILDPLSLLNQLGIYFVEDFFFSKRYGFGCNQHSQ